MMNHNMEKTSPKETYVVCIGILYYAVHGFTLRIKILNSATISTINKSKPKQGISSSNTKISKF